MHADERNRAMSEALGQDTYNAHFTDTDLRTSIETMRAFIQTQP